MPKSKTPVSGNVKVPKIKTCCKWYLNGMKSVHEYINAKYPYRGDTHGRSVNEVLCFIDGFIKLNSDLCEGKKNIEARI
jgi:hypothetical protein